MNILNQARFVVYRMHEKGVEFFLVDTGLTEDEQAWRFPISGSEQSISLEGISLEPIVGPDGHTYAAVAIEGDYHDIPSIRKLIKHDVKNITHKLKEVSAELEQGKFVILKEAFKRVLPAEYQVLKELKDVLIEKNLLMSI